MYLEYRYISIYIYSICKITSLSKYKCKLPSFTCMSSLNKYFKRKKTKKFIVLWYFVSKRRATKVSSTFKTNCTRISAGEWKCILPKKKSFDFQAKKSHYIMWQIIARIVKGNNFIFQIKKYCVSTNFTVFKITMLNFLSGGEH